MTSFVETNVSQNSLILSFAAFFALSINFGDFYQVLFSILFVCPQYLFSSTECFVLTFSISFALFLRQVLPFLWRIPCIFLRFSISEF